MAKRVLVVDDDADLRQTTRIVLSKAGYEIVEAASRKEAQQALKSQMIDLILLDVMMETDTEGFHFAYELRQDPKLKSIPIVMLTCIEQKMGIELEPQKAGDFLPVEAFLRKPVDPEKLTACVDDILK
ncbi:MAG: response regulator [Planctomycetes bacterium]|nr:response regulator [Planctomycetota bacterium]